MNGGFVHERVTLDRIETIALSVGALTRRQVRASGGGYVDLLIELPTVRIAVEAELTSKRIANDLTKAMELAASELWIVVPNVAVASSVRATLDRMSVRHGRRGVFVLTLGRAIQRLMGCFPIISGSLSDPENKKQIDRAACAVQGDVNHGDTVEQRDRRRPASARRADLRQEP